MNPWQKVKNILLVRLDNMGDVIMSNSAFRQMKRQLPHTKITLLTSKSVAALVPFLESIDDFIVFDSPWMKSNQVPGTDEIKTLLSALKKRQFDAAVIFNVYSQNILPDAMLCYMASIPLRAGYCRENPYHLLTHWLPDLEPLSEINHQIVRDLKLLQFLGYTVALDELPKLKRVSSSMLMNKYNTLTRTTYTIVNLGASENKRQLPVTFAQELLEALLAENEQIVLTGLKNNTLTMHLHDIFESSGVQNLIDQTNMEDLLFLTLHASSVITVNTGLQHIACAYDIPLLVLYANTNPQHTPWSRRSRQFIYSIPPHLQSKNQIIEFVQDKHILKEKDLDIQEVLHLWHEVKSIS